MEKLPHTYKVEMEQDGDFIRTHADEAPVLLVGAPPQFGGKLGNWSPETLILSSIGQCLFLTYVSICKASKFKFSDYRASVQGTLEKTDHGVAFTGAHLQVSLQSSDPEKAKRLLEKAEKNCLVTNSLNFNVSLEIQTN